MRGTRRPSDHAGLPCPECGTIFASEAGMATHRARAHGSMAYSARRIMAAAKKIPLDKKPSV